MEPTYKYKLCLCGTPIPFSMNNMCFDCIENRTKISGYIGSGKIQVK